MTKSFPKLLCFSSKAAKFVCSAATIALVTNVSTVSPASAQKISEDFYTGGKARVNQSAKLRALGEEVVSASCRLVAGIDAGSAEQDLKRTRQDITTILAGLRDGNAALGIPTPETFSANIKSMAAVNEVWEDIDSATLDILSGQTAMAPVAESYRTFYDRTVILASDMSGEYSDPLELLQADAITLNFAGRQTTLLNRMERITCGLAVGDTALGTEEELAETIKLFELSLSALRDGYPDAGISAPPNEAVKTSLTSAYDHWIAQKPVFDGILENGSDAESVIQVTALKEQLLKELNNTITLYLIATPGQEGIYRLPVDAYAEAELSNWLRNEDVISAIRSQNEIHERLTDDEIIAYDQEWRAQAKDGGGALISKLLDHDVSEWLREQQSGTAGLVTEVFIMDNKGLNVAQSLETSDYWQGDEAKWQQTFAADGTDVHIAEVEFDDSTGFYQTQASMPIFDPETNEKIGAITFGINVQSLL